MGTRPVLGQFSKPLTELERTEYKRLEEAWRREWQKAQNYRDIAEAALAFLEERLQAQKEGEVRLQRLMENTPDVISRYEFLPQRGFSYINPAITALTGYTPEEFYADPDLGFKLIHPDDLHILESPAQGEVSPGAPITVRWLRKDGTYIWTEQRNVPVYDARGNLIAIEAIARDITEHKKAEEELKSLARFPSDNPSPVLRIRRDGIILYANKASLPLLNLWRCQVGQFLPEYWRKPVQSVLDCGAAEQVEIRCEDKTFLLIFAPIACTNYLNIYALDISEQKRAEEALKSAALETLDALSQVIEATDPYTAGHSAMVAELASKIAKEIGLGDDQLNILRIACPLHDVGKVGIPSSILNKPTKLTQAEWLMIHAHPIVSAQTAERVSAFRDAVPAIRHHHERWDGAGYPDRLKGEEIPLLARILAVADGFEAMTSDRPYRRAFSAEEAFAELEKGAGTQWDPTVIDAFLRAFRPEH